ncbi:transglycosylase SLT domain-containing protein [Priestia aryabhattai]|uniref:tape measure protein n=1 Tax=Priestia aryabhattai TaxID=412384 RepID=UPI001C8E440F|nr:tape measure protein [Priestia aryabhattai]MBY0077900.1 transglycosylase SLT domain-containing protein [Priestia aryabhattai]
MAEVGSARVRITADDSQARSTLNGFTGFLKKTAGIASGVMAGLALFEGMKESVKAIGEATIGANASMEQYEQTLTVVLKSHEKAKDTLKWAAKFAQETPFEIPDIVEATTRLSAYGMNAQKVLKDTGDMAAVMGKPLMQAVEAVADAQTGELERLKEFGITKKMIIDQSKKMGMDEIVNSQGQITDLENFNKALFALMRSRYKGGMELQSQTFNGLISNAKDSMGTLLRTLSQPLFEKMKSEMTQIVPVMSSFTSFVQGDVKGASNTLQQAFGKDKANTIMGYFNAIKNGVIDAKNWIMQFEPAVRNLIDIAIGLGPTFKAVGGAIAVAFIQIAKILPPVINELTRVAKVIVQWEGFTPVVLGLASAFVTLKVVTAVTKGITALQFALTILMNPISRALFITQVWSKAMVFLNATLLANPIGLVIAAVVGLGVAFYEAYKHSKVFRDFVDGLWKKAKSDWVEFAQIMTTAGQRIAAQAQKDYSELSTLVSNTSQKIVTQATKDYNDLATGLALIGNRIKTQAQSDYNQLLSIAQTVGGRIKTQAQSDYNDISTALSTIGSRVKTQAQSDYNDILTVSQTVGGKIKRQALQDYTDFVNGANWVMNELPQKMNDWGAALDRFFDTLPGRTRAKLAVWGTAIKSWLIAQNEENKRQYGQWWNSIQSWIASKPAQWKASLNSWWLAISGWWDSLKAKTSTKFSSWWNSISTNVSNKYNSWKTALGRWWDAQSEWWSGLPSRTAQKISTWWSGIEKSVRSKYNNWKSALSRWWDAQSEWWSALPSKTDTKLNNWWKNISSWTVKTASNWRTSLNSWWKEIKNWFDHLQDRPEVKNSGKNLVKKVSQGSEEQKKTLFDKIGKIVVDTMKYAIIFAGIVILATGREIIKRMIKGVTQTLPEWYNKFVDMRKKTVVKLVDMGTHLYNEAKKIPGKIGKGIKDKMSDASGAMKSLADSLVKKFKSALGINSPSKVFYGLAGSIFEGIEKRLTGSDLKKVGDGIFDDLISGAGAGISSLKGMVSGAGGNLKSWLSTALAITGTPQSWLPFLSTMAMRESGGNPRAENHWDINERLYGGTFGLLQTIRPTFAANKLPGLNDIFNPIHNAVASIRYIKSRYGTIFNTPGIKSMMRGGGYKGYAKGGFFLNGPEMAMFGEGGPEMALPLIGKNMLPYAQAVAMNLSEMLGGLNGGGVDLSSLGPFILRVDLNGKTIAEQIYQDINEMQDRQDYRNRRSRGEV